VSISPSLTSNAGRRACGVGVLSFRTVVVHRTLLVLGSQTTVLVELLELGLNRKNCELKGALQLLINRYG